MFQSSEPRGLTSRDVFMKERGVCSRDWAGRAGTHTPTQGRLQTQEL